MQKIDVGAHMVQQLPNYLQAEAIGLSSNWRRRVRVMRLYTHDLQTLPDVPLQSGDSIATLERNRSAVLRDIYPVDLSEDQSRLDQEHKCFVGWSDGRAAHFSWVQDSGVHEVRGTWRRDAIRPGDFWIYSCRTADWARGRRLYPAALVTILRKYKNLNYQRALIYVAEENGASIAGIERAGFVLAERIRSVALRSSLFPLPGSSYRRERLPRNRRAQKAALPASESEFSVIKVAGKQALAPYLPLVEDLATRALEQNPFYEQWMLSSALDVVVGSSDLVFLLVFKKGPSTSGPRLCGFFPMMRPGRHHGLPVRSYRLLGHMYCFLGVPLVEADTAPSVLEHFLSACRSSRVSLVEFPMMPSGGEFHRVLVDVLHRRHLANRMETRYLRAVYMVPQSPGDYLAKTLSGKSRKHLRRQRERLAEMGRLDYCTLDSAEDPESWLREFLDLEASGWKGKEKTALASAVEHAAFFMEAGKRALERGAIFGSALRLNGTMIAGRILYRSGQGSYLFKIAYDEKWAAFSPGTLLELQTIENGLPDGVAWTDSCTSSSNTVFRRLWLDTRIIEHIVVSPGGPWGDLAIGVVPMLRSIKGQLRRISGKGPANHGASE